jgi:hypothetical protein
MLNDWGRVLVSSDRRSWFSHFSFLCDEARAFGRPGILVLVMLGALVAIRPVSAIGLVRPPARLAKRMPIQNMAAKS